jgi:hypothetical protein
VFAEACHWFLSQISPIHTPHPYLLCKHIAELKTGFEAATNNLRNEFWIGATNVN